MAKRLPRELASPRRHSDFPRSTLPLIADPIRVESAGRGAQSGHFCKGIGVHAGTLGPLAAEELVLSKLKAVHRNRLLKKATCVSDLPVRLLVIPDYDGGGRAWEDAEWYARRLEPAVQMVVVDSQRLAAYGPFRVGACQEPKAEARDARDAWQQAVVEINQLWVAEGPFDGILGLGGGATAAAGLAARSVRGLFPSIGFVVLCAGDASLLHLDAVGQVSMPSLHIFARSSASLVLAERFRSADRLSHAEAASLPRTGQVLRKLAAFLAIRCDRSFPRGLLVDSGSDPCASCTQGVAHRRLGGTGSQPAFCKGCSLRGVSAESLEPWEAPEPQPKRVTNIFSKGSFELRPAQSEAAPPESEPAELPSQCRLMMCHGCEDLEQEVWATASSLR